MKQIKISICCMLVVLMVSLQASAQQNTIDSLQLVLQTAKEDTNKVNILNDLSTLIGRQRGDHDTVIYYSNQARQLADKLGYKKGMAISYNNIGSAYFNQKNYPEALKSYSAALKLNEEIKNKLAAALNYYNIGLVYNRQKNHSETLRNYIAASKIFEEIKDSSNLAGIYSKIGYIYSAQDNYSESLNFFSTALKIYKQIGDKAQMAEMHNNIGINLKKQGNYPDAMNNHLTSLKIFEEIGSKEGMAVNYNNIGKIYLDQGNYTEALKNYSAALKLNEVIGDKRRKALSLNSIGLVYVKQGNDSDAVKNFQAALKINQEIGNNEGIASNYSNLGIIYINHANYPEALKTYFDVLKIYEEPPNKSKLALTYNNIGFIYTQIQEGEKGKEWLQKGLKISKEIGNKDLISLLYASLVEADTALGNFQGAYENYKMHILYRDSIYNEENTKKITRAALQYEFDKKEDSLKFQKRLTDEQLLRSRQELSLRQKELLLSNKEKDLQRLAFLKEQAEKQEKERRLTLAEKETELQQTRLGTLEKEKQLQASELATRNQQLATKQAERNLFIAGSALLLLLAGSVFVGFVRTKKQKKRAEGLRLQSDKLLLNILPAEVADELKTKGAAAAKQFDDVTVLFTDFVNFTQTAEHLSPQQLVQELNACFTAFDEITERNGLEKIKTVGDAYIAVCGLPLSDPLHAQKAVKAALEIRNFIEERKKTQNVFEIRIGVNSGSVVAGIVGVKKFAYDIWGDTVNTAARMESNGQPGKVNISETTYGLVKDEFDCTYRGKISAKGKGEVDMYFIENKNFVSLHSNNLMEFDKAKEFILSKLKKELPAHLTYHSVDHVLDVFESCKDIAHSEGVKGNDLILLLTAALFHDSGFIVQAKDHEEISCNIAQEALPNYGYTKEQIEKICGMIMATKIPQTPHNKLEEIIADADLDYLGRDDFYTIGQRLFEELSYMNVVSSERDWDEIQIRFLEKHHYFTPTSIKLRKDRKEAYLNEIKQRFT